MFGINEIMLKLEVNIVLDKFEINEMYYNLKLKDVFKMSKHVFILNFVKICAQMPKSVKICVQMAKLVKVCVL